MFFFLFFFKGRKKYYIIKLVDSSALWSEQGDSWGFVAFYCADSVCFWDTFCSPCQIVTAATVCHVGKLSVQLIGTERRTCTVNSLYRMAGFLTAAVAEGLHALLCDPCPLSCNLSVKGMKSAISMFGSGTWFNLLWRQIFVWSKIIWQNFIALVTVKWSFCAARCWKEIVCFFFLRLSTHNEWEKKKSIKTEGGGKKESTAGAGCSDLRVTPCPPALVHQSLVTPPLTLQNRNISILKRVGCYTWSSDYLQKNNICWNT